MFEIVTLDYWRKNYAYKMTAARQKWKEDYLANPAGLKHIMNIVEFRLRQEGKTDEQIEKLPIAEKLAIADAVLRRWPRADHRAHGISGMTRRRRPTSAPPGTCRAKSTTGISE